MSNGQDPSDKDGGSNPAAGGDDGSDKTSQVDLASVQKLIRQRDDAEVPEPDATGAFKLGDLQNLLDESREHPAPPGDATGVFDSQEIARAMAAPTDGAATSMFDVGEIAGMMDLDLDAPPEDEGSETQQLDIAHVMAEVRRQSGEHEAVPEEGSTRDISLSDLQAAAAGPAQDSATMQVGLADLQKMAANTSSAPPSPPAGALTTEYSVDRVEDALGADGMDLGLDGLADIAVGSSSIQNMDAVSSEFESGVQDVAAEFIEEIDPDDIEEIDPDLVIALEGDEPPPTDTQRVTSSLISDALQAADGTPNTERVAAEAVARADADEQTTTGRHSIVRSGSVPALWGDDQVAEPALASEDLNALKLAAKESSQLERFELPKMAMRLGTEMLGELEVPDAMLRAAYNHTLADTLRRSVVPEALALARDLDLEAVALDPTLIPAHMSLVADAMHGQRWDEAVDLLGAFATQVDELSQEESRLTEQTAPLYVQLELLLEHRLERRLDTLENLNSHVLQLGSNRLLAPLNTARYSLRAAEPTWVTAAYEKLVELSPAGLSESWAIDLIVYLWREHKALDHAREVVRLFLQNLEFSDHTHLAALQIFAWEVEDIDLEAAVALRWITALSDVHDRLGRSDTARRSATSERIGALYHRRALLAGLQGQIRDALPAVGKALEVAPDNLLYWRLLEELANDNDTRTLAIERQLDLITAAPRRAARLIDLSRLGADDATARRHLVAALETQPSSTTASLLLGRRHLLAGEYTEYIDVLRKSAKARAESLDPLTEAEILEQLIGDPAAAFGAYTRALQAEPQSLAALAGLERTGLVTGQYGQLVEAYEALIADENTPAHRMRELLWKSTQLVVRVVGDIDGNIAALERFVEFETTHLSTMVTLAELYAAVGRAEDAMEVWRRVASATQDPNEKRAALETRAELAAVYLGDPATTDTMVGELLTECPNSVAAWSIQRQAYLAANDYTALVELDRKRAAAEEDPEVCDALLLEAAWLSRSYLNDLEGAAAILETASDRWAPLIDLQEEVLGLQGDWPRLVALIRKRAERSDDPSTSSTLYEAAASMTLDRIGDSDLAAELYGLALTANGQDVPSARELCDLSWSSGNWELHLGNIDARLERNPTDMARFVLLRERGFVCQTLLGDAALAEESHLAMLEMGRDLAALRGLARLYTASGDVDSLLEVYGRMSDDIDDPLDRLYILTMQGVLMEYSGGRVSLEWLTAFANYAPTHPLVELSIARAERQCTEEADARRLVDVLAGLEEHPDALQQAAHLERIARLHIAAGQLNLARDLLEVAESRWPELIMATIGLVFVNDMLGDVARSAEACQRLASALPEGPWQLATLHATLERYRAAGKSKQTKPLKAQVKALEAQYDQVPVFSLEEPGQIETLLELCAEMVSHEGSAGLVYAEIARLAEGDEERALEAYYRWREAARLAPQVGYIRAALLAYATNDNILDEVRQKELREYLVGLCTPAEQVELWLDQARVAVGAEAFDRAREMLDRALEIAPGNRFALHAHADLAWENGNIEETSEWLSKLASVTTHRPFRAAIEVEVGLLVAAVLGRPADALIHYERALEAMPGDPSLLHFAARAAAAEQRWGDAARLRMQEAELHGTGAEFRGLLYQAARFTGRKLELGARAVGLIDRACADGPDGRLLRLQWELAAPLGDTLTARRLIAAAPSASDRARFCWLASETCDTPEEQTSWLHAALEQDPDYLTAALALELIAQHSEHLEDRAVALTARGRASRSTTALVRAGNMVEAIGDLDRAIELYSTALDLSEGKHLFGPLGPAAALLRVLETAESVEDEIAYIGDLLDLELSTTRRLALLNRLADLLTRQSREAEAARSWRQIAELDPGDAHARNCLAAVHTVREEWDALCALRRAELDKLPEGDERHPHLLWEVAELEARRLNESNTALQRLETALETHPRDKSLYLSAERLHQQLGDAEALIALQKRRLGVLRESSEIAQLAGAIGDTAWHLAGDEATAHWAFERMLRHDTTNLIALDAVLELSTLEQRAAALQALIAHEPDERFRASLMFDLATLFELGERQSQALKVYHQLSNGIESAAAVLGWERLATKLDQHSAYSEALSRSVEADTQGPHTVEYLARMLFLAPETERVAQLDALLESAPDDQLALVARFRRGAANNDLLEVAETCHALAASSHDANTEIRLVEAAVAFASVIDQPLAENAYWHVLENDPTNLVVVLRLLATLDATTAIERARAILEASVAASIVPTHEGITRTTLGIVLASIDDLKRADQTLDLALERYPRFVPAIKLQRFIAEKQGRYGVVADAAVLEAGSVVTPGAAVTCLLHAAGLRREKLNDIGGASRLLHQVLAREPLHNEAFNGLESIYKELSDRDALRALYRERAEAIPGVDEKKDLLFKASVVAVAAKDVSGALTDLEQRIRLEPEDLNAYDDLVRVATRHEQWPKAVRGLESKLAQTNAPKDKVKTLHQLAQLLDEQARDYPAAIEALKRLIALRPEDLDALVRIADLYERTKAYRDCIDVLSRAYDLDRDIGRRKQRAARMFRGHLNWFEDAAAAEKQMLVMRQLDPSDLSLIEELASWFVARKRRDDRREMLESSFRAYRELFLANPNISDALHALVRVSNWVDNRDRAFVVASLLAERDAANEDEQRIWEEGTREVPSLKNKPIATERLAILHAPGLSSSLLEVLRQCDRYLVKVSPLSTSVKALSRKHRVKPNARAEVGALEAHSDALGISLPPVYVVPRRDANPYLLSNGKDTNLVLVADDLDAQNLEATCFRAAHACAAIALGVPGFASLTFHQFMEAVLGVAQAVLPQQKFEGAPRVDDYTKALPRKVREGLTPFVLQIAKSLEEAMLSIEFQALQLTCMRYAIATMRDPSAAARVIRVLEGDGMFPITGAYRDTLQFIVSDEYFEVRKDAGIAFT